MMKAEMIAVFRNVNIAIIIWQMIKGFREGLIPAQRKEATSSVEGRSLPWRQWRQVEGSMSGGLGHVKKSQENKEGEDCQQN